jgi:DNA-binding MurR/RpiR family transcriptional regulator
MHPAKQIILDYIIAHPTEPYLSVARKINVSPATISRLAKAAGLPTRKAIRPDLSKLTDEQE